MSRQARPNVRRFGGFTLVEVLVGLAIIAVALMAALRAAGAGTRNAEDLKQRQLARWVAQNRLAEHTARGDWPGVGTQEGSAAMAGAAFTWREEVLATPNPAFRRIEIRVFRERQGEHAEARLVGFLTRPAP